MANGVKLWDYKVYVSTYGLVAIRVHHWVPTVQIDGSWLEKFIIRVDQRPVIVNWFHTWGCEWGARIPDDWCMETTPTAATNSNPTTQVNFKYLLLL